MYNNIKEEIAEIINEKNGVENKDIWIRVFQGLADYQEKRFEEIIKELNDKSRSRKDIWCVKTGLVEKNTKLDDGWSYVSDDDNYNQIEIRGDKKIIYKGYINCSYSELDEICKKEYI